MESSNPFVHNLQLPFLQKLKIVILSVTLLPIRLCFVLICLTLTSLLTYIGLYGLTSEEIESKPFVGWRLYIRKVLWVILRFMFFVCGFHHVKVIGKQADPSEACILVGAPHSTFFDAVAITMMGPPSLIAKAEASSVPFLGSLIKYTQPFFVHRNDPNSRQNTIKYIKERSNSKEDWQQILIFPEGIYTNRSSIVSFRPGAFLPGCAVQPVILRYENVYDTVTCTKEGFPAWKCIVYSLSQFNLSCSIEFMEPYVPSEDEIKDAQLFANNVRSVMAERAGVPTTEYTNFDYLRLEKPKRRSECLQKLQKRVDQSLLVATSFIEELEQDDPASVGEAGRLQLCNRLGVPPDCAEVESVLGESGLILGDAPLDLRDFRLAVLIASAEDSLTAYLDNSFYWWDSALGEDSMTRESCCKLLQKHLFLSSKDATEACESLSVSDVITKTELQIYITKTKPFHLKVLKAAEHTLRKNMTDLITGVFTSAATSLHKRMDSDSKKKIE